MFYLVLTFCIHVHAQINIINSFLVFTFLSLVLNVMNSVLIAFPVACDGRTGLNCYYYTIASAPNNPNNNSLLFSNELYDAGQCCNF